MVKTKAQDAGILGVQGGVQKHSKSSQKAKPSNSAPTKNVRQQRIDTAKKRRKANAPGKQAFYAVKVGREPGVYTDQAESDKQVRGFPNADAKKFKHIAEARAYVADAADTQVCCACSSMQAQLQVTCGAAHGTHLAGFNLYLFCYEALFCTFHGRASHATAFCVPLRSKPCNTILSVVALACNSLTSPCGADRHHASWAGQRRQVQP